MSATVFYKTNNVIFDEIACLSLQYSLNKQKHKQKSHVGKNKLLSQNNGPGFSLEAA